MKIYWKKSFLLKTFFHSFLCTSLLLTFIAGMIIADLNTKRVGFGDARPTVSVVENSSSQRTLILRLFNEVVELHFTCFSK